MTLGNILSNQEENVRYVAKFDSVTKTWRILDQWNDAIRTMTADDDIADDNPAVTILSDGQFTALLKEFPIRFLEIISSSVGMLFLFMRLRMRIPNITPIKVAVK